MFPFSLEAQFFFFSMFVGSLKNKQKNGITNSATNKHDVLNIQELPGALRNWHCSSKARLLTFLIALNSGPVTWGLHQTVSAACCSIRWEQRQETQMVIGCADQSQICLLQRRGLDEGQHEPIDLCLGAVEVRPAWIRFRPQLSLTNVLAEEPCLGPPAVALLTPAAKTTSAGPILFLFFWS